MAEGIARTRRVWPGRPVRIAAQQRLERFYASLGFRTAGAPYEEDDIAHVDMLLRSARPEALVCTCVNMRAIRLTPRRR